MASKRRGGFRPPELRGTLGTLFRTTTGVVRDALERGAREGRARFDSARATFDSARASLDGDREGSGSGRSGSARGGRSGHRRRAAVADLGELVLDLIRRGEIDLAELPEARALVCELDELDEAAVAETHDADEADDDAAALPRAAERRRFDDRASRDDRRPAARDEGAASRAAGAAARDEGAGARAARPTTLDRPRRGDGSEGRRSRDADGRADRAPPGRDADVDGTVSSGAVPRSEGLPVSERSVHASPSRPSKPVQSAWRPDADDTPVFLDHRSRVERWDAQRTSPIGRAERTDPTDETGPDERDPRPALPRDPTRKGGISFDDEDLADYMHPDDVPAKPSAADPDDHDP